MISATSYLRGPDGVLHRASEVADGTTLSVAEDNKLTTAPVPRYGEAVLHTCRKITTESGIELVVSNNAQVNIDDPERNNNVGSGGAIVNVQAIGALRIGVIHENDDVTWEAAKVEPAPQCHYPVVPVVAPGRGFLLASDTPGKGYILVTGGR